jgi:hypothetical protein
MYSQLQFLDLPLGTENNPNMSQRLRMLLYRQGIERIYLTTKVNCIHVTPIYELTRVTNLLISDKPGVGALPRNQLMDRKGRWCTNSLGVSP